MSEGVHDLQNESQNESEADALPLAGDFPHDPNVMGRFPEGTKILSTSRSGTSTWTALASTACFTVELPDGTQEQYFLKCATEDGGKIMMEGEFNAMSEIYKTMPLFVPKPHSWGKYRVGHPNTYFFLSQFINMEDKAPEPDQLCRKLAQLHKKSVSPTGKFGFHATTWQGHTPQAVAWESSWTVFFTNLLNHVTELDFKTNGYWLELDILEKRIFSDVILILIGNLERDGRTVKPCLIHGDLWEGNTGTSSDTGDIYIFDSAAFYAHNEMEIGDWRCTYNKINNPSYTETYKRHYEEISEPQEEWDDRNRMYSIYYNVIYSVNHKGEGMAVRQTAYDDMYYLIDKYAPFAEGEGPSKLNESERAVLSEERDHTAL
ncbi:hypothetical protein B7463_g7456, partial [Scytalidium lignicola]